ncbi:MAG: hypothetical protein PHH49_08595, partial [Candidatus Omnitrophica bacterium]|nr:hypothetical protein [Candidatus Omnitrophota bacterium]
TPYDAWYNPITGEVGMTSSGREKLRDNVLRNLQALEGREGIDRATLEGVIQEVRAWDTETAEKWENEYAKDALQTEYQYQAKDEYVVRGEKVLLIHKDTGRSQAGQRLQGRLHQLLEAKEGLVIRSENRTTSRITAKNLLEQFGDVSGMTGTISNDFSEMALMKDLYGMNTYKIAKHNTERRVDMPEMIFKDDAERMQVLMDMVYDAVDNGKPLIIHAVNIDQADRIAEYLRDEAPRRFNQLLPSAETQEGALYYQRLDATNEADEKAIVARAGQAGVITLSTPISGRGTDIKIKKTAEEYGLQQISMGYYDSKRVDAQVRGRSGRWGARGQTINLVSLQDQMGFLERGLARSTNKADRALLHRAQSINQRMMSEENAELTADDKAMIKRAFERAQKNITRQRVEAIRQQSRTEDMVFDVSNQLLELIDSRDEIQYDVATPAYIAQQVGRIVSLRLIDQNGKPAITNENFQKAIADINRLFNLNLVPTGIENALRSSDLDGIKLAISRVVTAAFTDRMVDEINDQAKSEFYKELDNDKLRKGNTFGQRSGEGKGSRTPGFAPYDTARQRIVNGTITVDGQDYNGVNRSNLDVFTRGYTKQHRLRMDKMADYIKDAVSARDSGDLQRARGLLLEVLETDRDNRQASDLLDEVNAAIEEQIEKDTAASQANLQKDTGADVGTGAVRSSADEIRGLSFRERRALSREGRRIGLSASIEDAPVAQVAAQQQATAAEIEFDLGTAVKDALEEAARQGRSEKVGAQARVQRLRVDGNSVTVVRADPSQIPALAAAAKAVIRTRDSRGSIPNRIVVAPEDADDETIAKMVRSVHVAPGMKVIISLGHNTVFSLSKSDEELLALRYLDLTKGPGLTAGDADPIFGNMMDAGDFGVFSVGDREFMVVTTDEGRKLVKSAEGSSADERKMLWQLGIITSPYARMIETAPAEQRERLLKTDPRARMMLRRLVDLSRDAEFMAIRSAYDKGLVKVGNDGDVRIGKSGLSVSRFYQIMGETGVLLPVLDEEGKPVTDDKGRQEFRRKTDTFVSATLRSRIMDAIKRFVSSRILPGYRMPQEVVDTVKAVLIPFGLLNNGNVTDIMNGYREATLGTGTIEDVPANESAAISDMLDEVLADNEDITPRMREDVANTICEDLYKAPALTSYSARLSGLAERYENEGDSGRAALVLALMLEVDDNNAEGYIKLSGVLRSLSGDEVNDKVLDLEIAAAVSAGDSAEYAGRAYRTAMEMDDGDMSGPNVSKVIKQLEDVDIPMYAVDSSDSAAFMGLLMAARGKSGRAVSYLRKAASMAESQVERGSLLQAAAKQVAKTPASNKGILRSAAVKSNSMEERMFNNVMRGIDMVQETGLTPRELLEAGLIDSATARILTNMGVERTHFREIGDRAADAIAGAADRSIKTLGRFYTPLTRAALKVTLTAGLLAAAFFAGIPLGYMSVIGITSLMLLKWGKPSKALGDEGTAGMNRAISSAAKLTASVQGKIVGISCILLGWQVAGSVLVAFVTARAARAVYKRISDHMTAVRINMASADIRSAASDIDRMSKGR